MCSVWVSLIERWKHKNWVIFLNFSFFLIFFVMIISIAPLLSLFRFYVFVKLSYTFAIFFSYFIQFYVPMQILIPPLQKGLAHNCRTGIDIFVRIAMVVTTCKLLQVNKLSLSLSNIKEPLLSGSAFSYFLSLDCCIAYSFLF